MGKTENTEDMAVGRCPSCGSDNVEHISRVTGFFSKVAGWNKGKVAELKDRNRNKGQF